MTRLLIFPRRGRIVLGTTLILLAASPVLTVLAGAADEGPSAQDTLKGITSVIVIVGVLSQDFEKDGFPAGELRTDIESRLRKAGIAVGPSAPAGLQILVNASKARDVALYGFNVAVEFVQGVRLDGDPQIITAAITWRRHAVGTVDAGHVAEVRAIVVDLVDQFISAYLEQNRKK